jgi:hypothetical protein
VKWLEDWGKTMTYPISTLTPNNDIAGLLPSLATFSSILAASIISQGKNHYQMIYTQAAKCTIW